MDNDLLLSLLTELRDFRRDIAAWQQDTGERVAALETQMKDVVGNGQPGRLTLAERSISALQSWRWWQVGAAAGVSGVFSILGWVIVRLVH